MKQNILYIHRYQLMASSVLLLGVCLSLLSGKAQANEGKALVDANCMKCHQAELYTRDNRKVKNLASLQTQVEACNTQLGTGWFPEDVAAVVDHLNKQYYKFKQ